MLDEIFNIILKILDWDIIKVLGPFLKATVPILGAIVPILRVILPAKVWDSDIEYGFKNIRQQNQYKRYKVFLSICEYGFIFIVSIVSYIYIIILVQKFIGIDKIKLEYINTIISLLYSFIWLTVFLIVSSKIGVIRIFFEDILEMEKGGIIKDSVFKIGYIHSCLLIFFIFILRIPDVIITTIDVLESRFNNIVFDVFEIFGAIECIKYLGLLVVIAILFLFIIVATGVLFCFEGAVVKCVISFFYRKIKSVYRKYTFTHSDTHSKSTITYSDKVDLLLSYSVALSSLMCCTTLEVALRLKIIGAIALISTGIVWIISRIFYNKMLNTTFLYYKKGIEKVYIYRKIGNQFLCSNKDYLQCEREAFYKNIREMRKTIEDKYGKCNEEGKNKLCKWINKLALYSGYIRIDEGDKCFKKLKQYIDSDTATVVSIETELIKMIGKFQEMTAVKLLPEDELKNYTIYPIIDEERSGFFN